MFVASAVNHLKANSAAALTLHGCSPTPVAALFDVSDKSATALLPCHSWASQCEVTRAPPGDDADGYRATTGFHDSCSEELQTGYQGLATPPIRQSSWYPQPRCRRLLRKGFCKYGDQCYNDHSISEARSDGDSCDAPQESSELGELGESGEFSELGESGESGELGELGESGELGELGELGTVPLSLTLSHSLSLCLSLQKAQNPVNLPPAFSE